MPRLSEWAGGAGEWTSGRVVDYVSMGCVLVCICVCVCVCVNMYVCSIARRIRSRARNGQMEARRQEWMDCVGKGERHLRFNLAVWREGRGGGWLSAFEANAALLEFQDCRLFGGFQ